MTNQSRSIGKATRPIFIPNYDRIGISTKEITFDWHMGMSKEVRIRSMHALHETAKQIGFNPILEASSKSQEKLGMALSAFYLRNENNIAVENLFQSSKVFENGQQYLNLLSISPKDAKKYELLKKSGNIIHFKFNEKIFPLEPKSLFYDWLYCSVLEQPHNLAIANELLSCQYKAFSDIEFNPQKSFSCQARTLAIYVTLKNNNAINSFLSNPIEFSETQSFYQNISYQKKEKPPIQNSLF